MTTINAKTDVKKAAMAKKAADLTPFVQKVWSATTLEDKKQAALAMADQFEVGGREDFIKAVYAQPTPKKLDQLATNAMLKGEGMSTKGF
jgi:hypothetical protein